MALILAAVGVYAVVSFTTARRAQEMGIRMALGARSASVVRAVMGASLRVTLPGVALGLLASIVVGRVIQGMVPGISPNDPVSLGSATLLLLAFAALAAFLPARKATRTDPLAALRAE